MRVESGIEHMTKPIAAGYSGTPLARKLGIKDGSGCLLVDPPAGLIELLEPLPGDVRFDAEATDRTDVVIVFATQKERLTKQLVHFRKQLRSDAMVWVSWPKKSSKVPSELSEDGIRDVALPLGFVDVKVCAISDVWSGLKLVVRKTLR
jgi:hypothetical protein